MLSVNQTGHGPVLILVPGANGTGDIFAGVAKVLADHFTVITYDRRGYGKTVPGESLPESAAQPTSSFRIDRDAADVVALADKFSPDQSVFVLGSSSGSIVVEKAFLLAPERFAKVGIHETPLMTVLPADPEMDAKFAQLMQQAMTGHPEAIVNLFKLMHVAPIDAKMMNLASDSKPSPAAAKSMGFWLKYEVAQYTGQKIDWNVFAAHHDKIVLFNGTDSVGFMPQAVDNAIALKIGSPVVAIPGGHLGYAQKSVQFAQTLAETFLG